MKRKYIITISISLVMFYLFALIYNLFELTEQKDIFKALTDSSLIVAVLDLGMAGLTFCSNKGSFRVFGYAGKSFILLFQRSDKKITERESYGDYCERKDATPKPIKHFLFVGLAYLTISIITYIIYYSI